MQTILGSGGAVGSELAGYLKKYTRDIRLVSRRPRKINDTDQLVATDLTVRQNVFDAVQGSEIVYVTIGFEYKLEVWKKVWIPFMTNVVDACRESGSKMLFFDNIYMLDPASLGHITEESPINPSSKKGKIRAVVDRMILERVEKGEIQASICRSPDFFSDKKETSVMMILVYDNLIKGKRAQWLRNAKAKHTMGYVPDLAAGMAILGNSPDSFGQVWNLPCDDEALTGEQWIKLFANELGRPTGRIVVPQWGIAVAGLFIPAMKEICEMSYQFSTDYIFDSSKFKRRFNYIPTSNAQAVHVTVEKLK